MWVPSYFAPLLFAAAVSPAASSSPCVIGIGEAPSSYHFVSSPWVSLYSFLVHEGKRSRGMDDDALGARGSVPEDTAAIRPLTLEESRRWKAAVEFFARLVIPDLLGVDSLVQKVNDPIAAAAPDGNLEDVPLPGELRRTLQDAMAIYRSTWWPAHDRQNHHWIAAMRIQLGGTEACLVQRAEVVWRAAWPRDIRVDATLFASWFGAYSTHHPTHITVSSNARGSQESFGLEVLLHETGHAMLGPLDSALSVEAARQRKQLPPDLSHLVLFYTSGALVKELQPLHLPFADAFGIWRQNGSARHYRDLIEREWRPYIAGARSFGDAVTGVVRGL
jgi:hypothetical protein